MMTYLIMKIAVWKESLNLDKKMSLGVGEAFFQLLTSAVPFLCKQPLLY